MPAPVQIPADIEREDRVLAELTARQVAILAAAAVLAYTLWTLTGPELLLWWAGGVLPIAVAAVVLAFGRRDGLPLDRVLWAALVQRIQTPTRPGPRPAAEPDNRGDRGVRRAAAGGSAPVGRAVLAAVPVRGVRTVSAQLGVVDLGGHGLALVCAVTPIHLAMHTEPEQAAALAGFGRWLHALSAPVQLLSRTRPLDLAPVLADLHQRAAGLPHPALAAAARSHAAHLAELGEAIELTTHEHLLVFRDPTPARRQDTTRNPPGPDDSTDGDDRDVRDGRQRAGGAGGLRRAARTAVETLCRRADEAAALLGPLGLQVTVLDAACAARVIRDATRPGDPDPAHTHPGPALTAAASAAGSAVGLSDRPRRSPGRPPTPPARCGPAPASDRGWDDTPTAELPVIGRSSSPWWTCAPAAPPTGRPPWDGGPWTGGPWEGRVSDDQEWDDAELENAELEDAQFETGHVQPGAAAGGPDTGWEPGLRPGRIREALDGCGPEPTR